MTFHLLRSVIDSDSNARVAPGKVFLHFHNQEILSLYGLNRRSQKDLLNHSLLCTRYALVISESSVVIQAKALFENEYLPLYLRRVAPLIASGILEYASASPSFEDEVVRKQEQFREDAGVLEKYIEPRAVRRQLRELSRLRWVKRIHSSTEAIEGAWRRDISNDVTSVLSRMSRRRSGGKGGDLILAEYQGIPERLQGSAFTLDQVSRRLAFRLDPEERTEINLLINRSYLQSHIEELDASILIDTPFGLLDCGLFDQPEVRGRLIRLSWLRRSMGLIGMQRPIEEELNFSELIRLRETPSFKWIVDRLFDTDRSTFEQAIGTSRFDDYRAAAPFSRRLKQEIDHSKALFDALSPKLGGALGEATRKIRAADRRWIQRGAQRTNTSAMSDHSEQLPLFANLKMEKEMSFKKFEPGLVALADGMRQLDHEYRAAKIDASFYYKKRQALVEEQAGILIAIRDQLPRDADVNVLPLVNSILNGAPDDVLRVELEKVASCDKSGMWGRSVLTKLSENKDSILDIAVVTLVKVGKILLGA